MSGVSEEVFPSHSAREGVVIFPVRELSGDVELVTYFIVIVGSHRAPLSVSSSASYAIGVVEIGEESDALVSPESRPHQVYSVAVFGSAAGFEVAEETFLQFLLDIQIKYFRLLSVVHSGKSGLLGLLVDYLHVLDQISGKVLRCHGRIGGEEVSAVQLHPLDGLPIIGDVALGVHLDPGDPAQ